MKKISSIIDDESGLTVEFRTFTVQELKKMTEGSKNWRHTKSQRVSKYLGEMRAGSWIESTGIPLIMDSRGNLIDGGHRAAAAAEFQEEGGHPIRWLVVSGARHQQVGEVVDTGLTRTFSQWLLKSHPEVGVGDAGNAATILRSIWATLVSSKDTNKMLAACIAHVKDGKGVVTNATPHDLRVIFSKTKDIVMRWVKFARDMHNLVPRPSCAAKVASMLCVAASNGAGPKAWEFAELMLGYPKLPTDHPASVLVSSLVRMASKASRRGGSGNTKTACAYTIKALRAFINEERIKMLSWKLEEDFPSLS